MNPLWRIKAIICFLACCRLAADTTPLPLEAPFTLGPYKGETLPTPVEIHFSHKRNGQHDEERPSHVAVELDVEGAEVAVFPCALLPSASPLGGTLAIFTPFPLSEGVGTWRAGQCRRFRIRQATQDECEGRSRLEVVNGAEELTVGNAFYRIHLAPVLAPLAGSANKLIRKITLSGDDRGFVPLQTTSDLTTAVDGKQVIHQWHFSPDQPPKMKRYGGGVVTVTYGGFYQQSSENRLAGVTWRMIIVFYADLPVVKIHFTRQQEQNRSYPFGRTMQLHFVPSNPRWPIAKEQLSMDEQREWMGVSDQKSQIAFLLPDNKTRGLAHWSPDWGYLCASWEAEGMAFSNSLDVREFYLLLSPTPDGRELMGRRLAGMRAVSETDWWLRTRQLFEEKVGRE